MFTLSKISGTALFLSLSGDFVDARLGASEGTTEQSPQKETKEERKARIKAELRGATRRRCLVGDDHREGAKETKKVYDLSVHDADAIARVLDQALHAQEEPGHGLPGAGTFYDPDDVPVVRSIAQQDGLRGALGGQQVDTEPDVQPFDPVWDRIMNRHFEAEQGLNESTVKGTMEAMRKKPASVVDGEMHGGDTEFHGELRWNKGDGSVEAIDSDEAPSAADIERAENRRAALARACEMNRVVSAHRAKNGGTQPKPPMFRQKTDCELPDSDEVVEEGSVPARYRNGVAGLVERMPLSEFLATHGNKNVGTLLQRVVKASDLNTGTVSGKWYDIKNMEGTKV